MAPSIAKEFWPDAFCGERDQSVTDIVIVFYCYCIVVILNIKKKFKSEVQVSYEISYNPLLVQYRYR